MTDQPLPPLQYDDLMSIGHDTIERSEDIVTERASDGASSDGHFVKDLPPLDPANRPTLNCEPQSIDVINLDSLSAARVIMSALPESRGKVAVLNLASDILPCGPWLSVWTKTQVTSLGLLSSEG